MNYRFLILPCLLLAACSSKVEKKTPPLMSQRMSDRIATSRKRMNNPNDRSVFDKSMQSSIGRGKNTGGWLGRKNYKSNNFSGTKSYTNTKGYKTTSFQGADSKNRLGSQSFAEKDKMSAAAQQSFQTSESRFASQSAREGSQTFDGADTLFKTSADRDALRSQKKNDRPKFIELEENKRDPAYTEEQVRRLLGRD